MQIEIMETPALSQLPAIGEFWRFSGAKYALEGFCFLRIANQNDSSVIFYVDMQTYQVQRHTHSAGDKYEILEPVGGSLKLQVKQ